MHSANYTLHPVNFVPWICLEHIRKMMCDDGVYGDGTLGEKLDRAYEDFRAFCRAKRISCSQPPFTPKLVLWMKSEMAKHVFASV